MRTVTARGTQAIQFIKALLASYIVTGISLLVLSFLLLKLELDEQTVTIGIIAVYVLSTFVGGFILGKLKKSGKFLWGFFMGLIYFLLLLGISFGVYRNFDGSGMSVITTLLLCSSGGMLGGMLA